jgi:hypothetical protein
VTDDTELKLKGDTYRETVELSESHFESKGCVMGGKEEKGKKSRNGRGADEILCGSRPSALGGTVLAQVTWREKQRPKHSTS